MLLKLRQLTAKARFTSRVDEPSALTWREGSSGLAALLATVALAASLGDPTEVHRHVDENGLVVAHDHLHSGAHDHEHSHDGPFSVDHRDDVPEDTSGEAPDRDSRFVEEPQLVSVLPGAAVELVRPRADQPALRLIQNAEGRHPLATPPARGPPAVC